MIKKLWLIIGRIAYWFVFPLLAIYLRIGSRTRLVLKHDDCILVVKGWLGSGKWSLPGGGLHRGEDPIVGVIRELCEETGIVLKEDQFRPGDKAILKQGIVKFRYYRFFVQISQRPLLRPQKWEIQEIAWLRVSSLDTSNADQSLLDTVRAFNTHATSVTM
jgi:8-oxo-dGTP pyrophosphatase MutT (NUDIX family)